MSDSKFEIRIRHITGGIKETRDTGEYPDYYLLRSRKYSKTWRFKKLPNELKYKGKMVYLVEDVLTVYDCDGQLVEEIEFEDIMRD